MESRDEILYQALLKNEEETQKWLKYKSDHEDAIKNLEEFRKKVSVEVMVPIGSKALIPGFLTHTNEVFVSHFGKFISKCTSYQAQEICKNRIKIGEDFLSKLGVERDMFKNNLEIPHIQGAMPGMEMQEIIEDYDEEKEKQWRDEHKKRVRLEKLKEQEKIKKEDKTYENIIMKLEELELLEELETELEELKIEDDETLKKLMSGDIKVQEKKRVSHYNMQNKIDIYNDNHLAENLQSNSNSNFKADKSQKVEHDIDNVFDNVSEGEVSDSSSDEDIPEEFMEYRKQAEQIASYDKKLSFVKRKIKLIEKEIDNMKINNITDLDHKLNKVEIRDYLIDFAFTLEDQEDSYVETKTNNMLHKNNISKTDNESEKKIKKNQRISFVLEDDVTYIDQNEKVENMLIKKQKDFGKDKIVLDPEFQTENNLTAINNFNQNKLTIFEKVRKNINYMQETQSHEDFDLVSKILNCNNRINPSLQIKFKHSACTYKKSEQNTDIIESPADFYKMYGEQYPQNLESILPLSVSDDKDNLKSMNKLDSEKAKNLKEFDSITVDKNEGKIINKTTTEFHTDAKKVEFVKKQVSKNEKASIIPTILKNKDAVKQEQHYQTKNDKINETTKPTMILGDVIANTEPQKCDDLPNGNVINTHMPKKRISRFKQGRILKST